MTKYEVSREEALIIIAELARRTARYIEANPGAASENSYVVENVTKNVLRMKKLLEEMK